MENEIEQYKLAMKKAVKKINELNEEIRQGKEDIAIIGYNCRFPGGANSAEKFWERLAEGYDAVREVPADRFNINDYYDENGGVGKTNTKYASFIDTNIKEFDCNHFEISPKEASSMDPQHKLLLEVSWETLQNAGLDIEKLRGSKTGVFVGIDSLEYFKSEMFSGNATDITPYSLMGVSQHSAAGRLSYFYDFKGPAAVLSTACSSSLTAMNMAIDNLRNGQCDMALVAGVNLILSPEPFVGLTQFHAISSDGRCRTFDEQAGGFGRGEGCGVVLLRRLSDAKQDGNSIEAIVKGISVGHDGRTNGFFAPNGLSEQNVIKHAMEMANVSVDDVDYIETHGTATSLGDFIETQAIADVYKKSRNKIKIGAVKSNIGHLEAAAGMAGLIKVLLSIRHKQLPPSIHFHKANPNIDWNKVEVVNKLTDWNKEDGKLRAGVSAFGISGTLVHVIVEEYKEETTDEKKDEMSSYLFTLSGKTEKALKANISDFKEYVENTNTELEDIAYSSNLTRGGLPYRFSCVAGNKEELHKKLMEVSENEALYKNSVGKVPGKGKKIAFLFTGQGSIYVGIAKEFYHSSKPFQNTLKLADERFKELLNISIIDTIYSEDEEKLTNPYYIQPIIFSVEYALTKIYDALGIKPDVVIGHSIGEYAAACYAGLLTFEDAMLMIAWRSQLMNSLDIDGRMVGILTDEDTVKRAIQKSGCENVSIGAVNAQKNITLSGLREDVDKVIETLQEEKRVFINDLKITRPFHSVVVKPYEEAFSKNLESIEFHELTTRMISSVTGKIATKSVVGTKEYWKQHLSETVQYKKAIDTAEEMNIDIYIEIGGNATLTGLAHQSVTREDVQFLPTLRNGIDNYEQLFQTLGQMYRNGITIDWRTFYDTYEKQKVELPSYSFQKKESWKNVAQTSSIISTETVEASSTNSNSKEITYMSNYEEKGRLQVVQELKDLIHMITGMEQDEIENDRELFSFGFDSLLLMTLGKQISEKYRLEIPLDVFFTTLNTLDKISDYIVENTELPEVEEPIVAAQEIAVTHTSQVPVQTIQDAELDTMVADAPETATILQKLFDNQYRLMSEQNEILKALVSGKEAAKDAQTVSAPINQTKSVKARAKTGKLEKINYYVPYHKMVVKDEDQYSELELQYINAIQEKYTSLTKVSKENIQKYRSVHANARNSAGFKMIYKEMIYQIIAESGHGSRIVDIDGNEFIDVTMGFGVSLFGHGPEFVKRALKDELENGMPLGPMGRLAGEVARKISNLTGAERVFFCNSGTEADMFAVRIARASTGKDKIVAFRGSYHGTYDGLLGLPFYEEDGTITSIPMAPGITQNIVKDLVLFNYDSPDSIRYIEEHADEIAGVLVETVQSRRPDLQPREFLRTLRKVTEEKEIALIFDEVITGFRIAAGGVQEEFGIRADMVTYGKVVGGGMPIGVVTGNAKFMDSVDGGMWQFGDDSVPPMEDKRTYVAGTFCHHPMAMAASNAVLDYIEEHKDTMYHDLNTKTSKFIENINTFFDKEKIPFHAVHFGSVFRINIDRKYEIFYYGLLEKGIYVWEGRNCFLSISHTAEDIEKLQDCIKKTAMEMKNAGFFDGPENPDARKRKQVNDKNRDTRELRENKNSNDENSMSMIQQRLYSQISITESDPFDMVSVFELKSDIDIAKVERILNEIIGRHEILRTSLYMNEGEFCQKVMSDWEFAVKVVDDQECCDVNEAVTRAICKFDLSKPPLVETILLNISDNRQMLVFHFHHTASDGMSMNLFVQEFTTLYNGDTLKPLKKQYLDFVAWEQKYLSSEKIKGEQGFWINSLKDTCSTLPFFYDYSVPAKFEYTGNTLTDAINQKLTIDLKELGKKNGATIFMVLLAATEAFLYKVTGERNLAVTTPVSSRFDGGFEENIGMFTNTIALAGHIEEKQSFGQFLIETKKHCLKAYSYMDYPYNLLIQELKKFGHANGFNVNFVYENVDIRDPHINGLDIRQLEYTPTTQEFDLTIELLEKNGVIDVFWRYQTELFASDSMQTMMKQYLYFLTQLVSFPEKDMDEILIVDESERETILSYAGEVLVDYPEDKTVVDLFEEAAEKYPERIALAAGEEMVTYQELNEKANILANKLREAGVKPDSFVPLISRRNKEMLIAILGIIKAGGAYVPINAEYPKDRIQYILEDCHPAAVILNGTGTQDYEIQDVPVFQLDKADIWDGDKTASEHVNTPENLLYVIYTSGTTGKPKGVMVEHRNLVRLLFNDKFQYEFSEQDVWMIFHSFCFDFSVWEIFGSLLYGGKLVVLSQDVVQDSEKVLEELERNKVTVFNQVPSSFYNIMRKDNGERMKSVRYLIFGGEALNPAKLEQWKKNYPQAVIVNMYGITETTVHVTYREITEAEIKRGISDIGKAIPTLATYVMNGMKLCGIGIAGELCVAGAGVSRGYLNREELTKEKFINNPFGEGKMYRSGDLVRMLPDGNLEYLGRIDEQVKIRGFRIELGEIENALRKVDGIEEAAVIVRADSQGDKAIIAYVVAKGKISVNTTKEKIAKTLPDYMIPSYIMQIDAIPVTNNGKLNRKALPEVRVVSEKEYVAPDTDTQKTLAEVFEKILEVERVGIHDDFFELGGHSLKATRAMNQIEKATGIKLPVKTLFQCHTISELANVLEAETSATYQSIPKAEEKPYYNMSSIQKRIFMVSEMDKEGLSYNMPVAMKLEGTINIEDARNAITQIIRRHEILRTRFFVKDGVLLQEVLDMVEPDFTYIEKTVQTDKEILNHFVKPFSLSEAPLFRIQIVKRENYYMILFDMHHIVGDGMSMGIIMKEFSMLYNGASLMPCTLQYKDYSEWIEKEDMESQKKYWCGVFEGDIPVLDIPTDYQRPLQQSYRGATEKKVVSKELEESIHQLAMDTNSSEYMIYLASAMILLEKYSRQEDIVIGSPISGRIHKDTESMLGMFVNTLAMRGKPEEKKGILEFLEEIKENCLQAYDNQEYPFEKLVEDLDINRDLARNPLFDVMLVLQNNKQEDLIFGTNKAHYMEWENDVAKFDITFNICQTEEELVIEMEYCTDLYRAETINRMLCHYYQILKQVCSGKVNTIADISLITEEEKAVLLEQFNLKEEPVLDQTIIDLFEEQVKQSPEKTAVVFEDKELTYGEFNEKVNTLARKLRELGVGRNDFVVIMAERSLEMMIGIFAILKAGGAYVPVLPNYPKDRIDFILSDCEAKVMLTYHITYETDVPVIELSELDNFPVCEDNLEKITEPEDNIYCIYTSGTTGKPKGVVNKHSSLLNLILWMQKTYPLTADDAILQKTTYVFDVSASEILWWCVIGARIVMLPPGDEKDPEAIISCIDQNKISMIDFVPSMLSAFLMYVKEENVSCLDSLKYVIAAGEALSADVSNKFYELVGTQRGILLADLYGPTEASIYSTYFDCQPGLTTVPIGKPVGNVQIHVINKENKLAGIGVPGELCIAGQGLAKGYLKLPELTNEKFVENPFGQGKMYRSGDLARWTEDGYIEYLGRIDDQVKVRGFRIELDEVRGAIARIPEVDDTAVITRDNQAGMKEIYAYLVSKENLDIADIKSKLTELLPEYMIPAYMMQIHEIPVTRNGKLDMKALPEIEFQRDTDIILPRTEEERVLAGIFCEILGLNEVCVTDNFFKLGGDSIKAIRMVSKLRDAGYEISFREIMQMRTVESIAGKVQLGVTLLYEQGEVVGTVPTTPVLNEFIEWNLKKPEHFNQAVMIPVDSSQVSHITRVFEVLAEHHDILRAVYVESALVIKSMEEWNKPEMLEFDVREESDQEAKINELATQVQESLGLEEGPLVKYAVFHTKEADGSEALSLLIVIHHLVVDGVSWRILLEDFNTILSQLEKGTEVQLSSKTSSFIDWANALEEYKENNLLLSELPYWEEVEKMIGEGKLSTEEEEGNVEYDTIEFAYSKEDTNMLLYEAEKAYNTEVNDLLLGALSMTVKEWKQKEKVAVLLEGHGRQEIHKKINIDRTVGWFTNMYPVVLECRDNMEEAIITTKEMLRKIPNSGIGYGLLKEKLNATRPDICFNYLGQMDAELVETNKKTYPTGESIATENKLPGKINLDGIILQNQLSFTLTYEKRAFAREGMIQIQELYKKNLENIIRFCSNKEESIKTMSDYGTTKLEASEFDEIMDLFQ